MLKRLSHQFPFSFPCSFFAAVAHAGSLAERIDPLHFLDGCHKRWLNQALSVFSVSIGFFLGGRVFCCLLGPLFVLTLVCACMFSVSWLLLVKLSVLARWLARKTPLRMPLHGKEIISTKPRPKSAYAFWFIVSFRCFIVCFSFILRAYTIYFILLWHDIACLSWKCR